MTRTIGLHRAERFLLVDPHVRRYAIEQRCLDDGALPFAAAEQDGALGNGIGYQRVHTLRGGEVDERPQNHVPARIAGGQA